MCTRGSWLLQRDEISQSRRAASVCCMCHLASSWKNMGSHQISLCIQDSLTGFMIREQQLTKAFDELLG